MLTSIQGSLQEPLQWAKIGAKEGLAIAFTVALANEIFKQFRRQTNQTHLIRTSQAPCAGVKQLLKNTIPKIALTSGCCGCLAFTNNAILPKEAFSPVFLIIVLAMMSFTMTATLLSKS